MPERTRTSLAAFAYLLVILWMFRAVLPVFSSSLPQLTRALGPSGQLGRWDQSMVVGVVTQRAHALVTNPARLYADGQCFPMAHSYTLGEHMTGTGLLAALPYLVTRDPIATYNLVLILSVWIPGITMYLLSREFVSSSAAAFVAGLLFAVAPVRLADFGHPFVHGDLWTPLALLFLHRTVTRTSWRNAVGLTIFCSLTLLESFYTVIAASLLIGCFAVFLLWRYPREFRRALPQLLASLLVILAVAWATFSPYLETRATWSLLGDRVGFRLPANFLGITDLGFPLALIGLLDRLRGPREVRGWDPRLGLVVGGLLVYWCAVGLIPVPGLDLELPSPLLLLRDVVPGLDAVRAPGAIGSAVGLTLSFLAGYGVLALTERMGAAARVAVASVLVVYLIAERSHAPLARWSFGTDFEIGAWQARPSEEDLRLLRASEGPILRLPYPVVESLKSLEMASDLKLVSYDPRPTASCYNSFPSPLHGQIHKLAAALPDPAAAEALHAIGFRTVMLVTGSFWPPDLRRVESALTALRGGSVELVPLGRTARLAVYRLTSRTPSGSDPRALLAKPDRESPHSAVAPGRGTLSWPIENHAHYTFRQPQPILPSDVVVRWRSDDGRVEESRERVLLPLALAPGGRYQLPLDVQTPSSEGHYRAELALAERPDDVLASLDVEVSGAAVALPPTGVPGPPPSNQPEQLAEGARDLVRALGVQAVRRPRDVDTTPVP